jgi:hypothetical protein
VVEQMSALQMRSRVQTLVPHKKKKNKKKKHNNYKSPSDCQTAYAMNRPSSTRMYAIKRKPNPSVFKREKKVY